MSDCAVCPDTSRAERLQRVAIVGACEFIGCIGFATLGKMLEDEPCPGDVSFLEQVFCPLKQDRGVGGYDWVERGTWARHQVEKGRGPVRARGRLIGLLLRLDA